jgi:hypothetical protein
VGEWKRERVLTLGGMLATFAVGITLVVAVDNMEFKAVGAYFALVGLVGAGIALFRWTPKA